MEKVLLPLFLMGFIFLFTLSANAQNITPATGGENISVDDINGAYTQLSDIIVDETSAGQISQGEFTFNVPEGFEWDVNATPSVTIEAATGYNGKGTSLVITFSSITATELTFNVITASDQPPNKAGKATFSGLAVRPVTAELPNQGNITATGSSVSNINANYGTLKTVAGAPTDIFIETAADGSGNKVTAQDLTAGTSIDLFAISRDQGGNFIANVAADNWNRNIQNGLTANPLSVSSDRKSATFSSTLIGSASISATKSGLISNSSGIVTVVPDSPATLKIQAQPSASNTAGTVFSTPPVLLINDQYGNLVTSNSFTSVTASRSAGSGILQGTTTEAANNGVITFDNLYHTVANDISISFSAPGLTGITSRTIAINPAAADGLQFKVQPQFGAVNAPLDPAPVVQLVDSYGNLVSTQNVTVNLVKIPELSGAGNLNGTSTLTTNSNGVAVFDDIKFNKSGSYAIKATSSGLKDSENSSTFTIANTGSLAGFKVEKSGGGTIGTQTAGEPFSIRIAAVDGAGDILNGQQGRNNFTGHVNLTTTSDFADAVDTTQIGPFVNGVYDPSTPYDVELVKSGTNITVSATNSDGSESGSSNPFTVNATNAFPDSTKLALSHSALTANGNDTTLITVQLKDFLGNSLTAGGNNVSIDATAGNLSPVTDNGDGTYSATLTAPADVGFAAITVDVDGSTASGVTETVKFEAGSLATFLIEDAGGNSGTVSNQTAGSPFDIKITAKDTNNNTIESFNSTVEITSDASFSSGSGTTAPFINGVLASHQITLTSAGDFYIVARNSITETGQSNLFTVSPASADKITSTVTAGSQFLKNDGTDATPITVQLKDRFGNNLTSQNGNAVNLFFESSTNALLNNTGNTTYEGNGIYTGTLTAGTDIETVNVIGSLNNSTGSDFNSDIDTVEVVITEINTWNSQSGGNRTGKRDWSIAQNWSLTSIPSVEQVTQIPTTPVNGSFYPIIAQDATIDFLEIQEQATVNLEPGYTMTMNYDLSGLGTFICDRSTVIIHGDLTVATYASTTCNTTFTGSGEAKITGNALLGKVTIDKDLTLTGSLQSLDTLIVTEGNTLTVEDGAELDIQGPAQINGELEFNGGHLKIGYDVNNPNIDISNTTVEFNGTEPQDITGLDDFSDLIINNNEGVTFHNDVVVDDTLFIEDGVLIIDSGSSLVSTVKSGNVSNIRMLREISGTPGWRMIAPPLVSTYEELFDGTLTQGYPNSQLGNAPEDSLQPNVLFYNETYPGTDNQRWRAPKDANESLTPGRGLFVYFFGNIPEDDRYNDSLPDVLTINGAENEGNGTSFTFPVTYTADADTGWNLVGNPFAATIDWDDDGNWIKANMDNVLYVWDPAANDYLTWNGIDGSLGDGLIMPFQAFWVKANGNGVPELKVNESSKTTGGDFKGKTKKEPAAIEFLLEADSLDKTTHITLSPDGKTGKDRRDAFRLLPFETNTYLELYTTFKDGTQLAINNLARSFGKQIAIPMYVGGFKDGNPINGTYTLSWPQFSDVPDEWTLVLEDQKTGKKINLEKNSFYSFDVSQSKQKGRVKNTVENFQLTMDSDTDSKSKMKTASPEPRFLLKINPGADAKGIPKEYSLGINYPNPFSESTIIKFATPLEGRVQILIYDILGRKVKTIVNEDLPADFHEVQWNPSQLASGIYIYVMRAGGKQFSKKLTFIK